MWPSYMLWIYEHAIDVSHNFLHVASLWSYLNIYILKSTHFLVDTLPIILYSERAYLSQDD